MFLIADTAAPIVAHSRQQSLPRSFPDSKHAHAHAYDSQPVVYIPCTSSQLSSENAKHPAGAAAAPELSPNPAEVSRHEHAVRNHDNNAAPMHQHAQLSSPSKQEGVSCLPRQQQIMQSAGEVDAQDDEQASAQPEIFDLLPTQRKDETQQASGSWVHHFPGKQEATGQTDSLLDPASIAGPAVSSSRPEADAALELPCQEASSGRSQTDQALRSGTVRQHTGKLSRAEGKSKGHKPDGSEPMQVGADSLGKPALGRLHKRHRKEAQPPNASHTADTINRLHLGKPMLTDKHSMRRHSSMLPGSSAAATCIKGHSAPKVRRHVGAITVDANVASEADAASSPKNAETFSDAASPRALATSPRKAAASPRASAASQRRAAASQTAATASPRASAQSPRSKFADQAAAGSRPPFLSTIRSGQIFPVGAAAPLSPRSPPPAAAGPAKRQHIAHSAHQQGPEVEAGHSSQAGSAEQSQRMRLLEGHSAPAVDMQTSLCSKHVAKDDHVEQGVDVMLPAQLCRHGQHVEQQSHGQDRPSVNHMVHPLGPQHSAAAVKTAVEHLFEVSDHKQHKFANAAPSTEDSADLQLAVKDRHSSSRGSGSESQHSSASGSNVSSESYGESSASERKAAASARAHFGQHSDSVGSIAQLFMMRMRARVVFQVSVAAVNIPARSTLLVHHNHR